MAVQSGRLQQTRLIMGMPITVEIAGAGATDEALKRTFAFFEAVDRRFSTYRGDSEISRVNGGLPRQKWSRQMRQVLDLCEQTRRETDGYFDIRVAAARTASGSANSAAAGQLDPSGLVKGWAIWQAAARLGRGGISDFYIDAGGDVQTAGRRPDGQSWRVGIRNPFDRTAVVKVLELSGKGVATSGTAVRGQHIYNPHAPVKPLLAIKSLTVVGPNVYEADRFATAAFAMGPDGIGFIEKREGLEGYMIDAAGMATYTSGFERYVAA